MKKYVRVAFPVLLGLGVAACATGPEKPNQYLLDYQAAAGKPVASFHYFTLWSWETLGNNHLAVYTRSDEAYLLELDGTCRDLEFTNGIVLTSRLHEVTARFDRVLVHHSYPCRIMQIQPVNVKQLRAEEKAQRERKIEEKERQEQ